MPTPQNLFIPRSSLDQSYQVGRRVSITRGPITLRNRSGDELAYDGSQIQGSRLAGIVAATRARMKVGAGRFQIDKAETQGTVVTQTAGTRALPQADGETNLALWIAKLSSGASTFYCTVLVPDGLSQEDLEDAYANVCGGTVEETYFLSSDGNFTASPGPIVIAAGEGADYTYDDAPLAASTVGAVTPVGDEAAVTLLEGATDAWAGNYAPYAIAGSPFAFTQGEDGTTDAVTWYVRLSTQLLRMTIGDTFGTGHGVLVAEESMALVHGGMAGGSNAAVIQMAQGATSPLGVAMVLLQARLATMGSPNDTSQPMVATDASGFFLPGMPGILLRTPKNARGVLAAGSFASGGQGPGIVLERANGGLAPTFYQEPGVTFLADTDVAVFGGGPNGRKGYILVGNLGGTGSSAGPGFLLFDSHGVFRGAFGGSPPAWMTAGIQHGFLAAGGNLNQADTGEWALHVGAAQWNRPGLELTDDTTRPLGTSPNGLTIQAWLDAGHKFGTTDAAAVQVGRLGADVVVPAALWVGPGSQGALYLTAHASHAANSMPTMTIEGHAGTRWHYWVEDATGILRRSSSFPTSDSDGVAITT